MKHKLSERKPSTKGRPASPQKKAVRRGRRKTEAEVALATLLALLHADRWLFEASELAKKGNLGSEVEEFNRVRLSIVGALNRLQPRAYGAMKRGSILAGG